MFIEFLNKPETDYIIDVKNFYAFIIFLEKTRFLAVFILKVFLFSNIISFY